MSTVLDQFITRVSAGEHDFTITVPKTGKSVFFASGKSGNAQVYYAREYYGEAEDAVYDFSK